jgi:hypothetical protein
MMPPIANLPKIGSIPTMPSRLASFEQVLPTILPQLDLLYVHLDGHDGVPSFLAGRDNVVVSSGDELRGLRADSRMLCLERIATPSVVFFFDDDILYPSDYVSRLTYCLSMLQGNAVVGVHSRIFLPPHQNYLRDAQVMHFQEALPRPIHVHELGTGTMAFLSDRFRPDPTRWKRRGMSDINLAVEAERCKLPRVTIDRAASWLAPIAEEQEDSLWRRTKVDHADQGELMRLLLSLYR